MPNGPRTSCYFQRTLPSNSRCEDLQPLKYFSGQLNGWTSFKEKLICFPHCPKTKYQRVFGKHPSSETLKFRKKKRSQKCLRADSRKDHGVALACLWLFFFFFFCPVDWVLPNWVKQPEKQFCLCDKGRELWRPLRSELLGGRGMALLMEVTWPWRGGFLALRKLSGCEEAGLQDLSSIDSSAIRAFVILS